MKPVIISKEEANLAKELAEWTQYKKECTDRYEPYVSFEEWRRV